MRPSPVLETDRLLIRELEERDLDPLADILGDPETMRFYPHPFSREEARAWIERNRARYLAEGFGLWAVQERASGAFLGDCGLTIQMVEGIPEVEIGWHVVRQRWRQGIATEAAHAVRAHGFSHLGLRRIVSLIRPENEASCGVARRLGMRVEREVDHAGFRHFLFVQGPEGLSA